jgi:hypothetical protein
MTIIKNIIKHYWIHIMILLKMVIIYLCYNIYMDVVNEIEILESDVRDCNEKCERVNCHAIYDAIISSFKLMYDLIIMCYRKKEN